MHNWHVSQGRYIRYRPTRWGIITGPPNFKCHNFVNIRFIYTKNFRQYSRGNAESGNLKIIRLLIKCSLQAAVYWVVSRSADRLRKSDALPSRHAEGRSFTPDQVSPVTCPQSNAPSQSLAPLVKAHTKCSANTSRIFVSRSGLQKWRNGDRAGLLC